MVRDAGPGDFSSSTRLANPTHSSCKDSFEQGTEVDHSFRRMPVIWSRVSHAEGVSECMDTVVVMTEEQMKGEEY